MSPITRDLIASGHGGVITWQGALLFISLLATFLAVGSWATYAAIEHFIKKD